VAATGLDRANRQVRLANGDQVSFDRLLIATGTRARQWPNPTEAALDGVFTLRTRDDAARVQARLAAGPQRGLIVGAGFMGAERPSVCGARGFRVPAAERGAAPLVGALGGVIGATAAGMQREHGGDLRPGVSGAAPGGDQSGHVQRARLSDGSTV